MSATPQTPSFPRLSSKRSRPLRKHTGDRAASSQKHDQHSVKERNDTRRTGNPLHERQQLFKDLRRANKALEAERASNKDLTQMRDHFAEIAEAHEANLNTQKKENAVIRHERDRSYLSLAHLARRSQILVTSHSTLVKLLGRKTRLSEQEKGKAVEAEEMVKEYLTQIYEMEEWQQAQKTLGFSDDFLPTTKQNVPQKQSLNFEIKSVVLDSARRVKQWSVDQFSQLSYHRGLYYLIFGFIFLFVLWVVICRSDMRLGWL